MMVILVELGVLTRRFGMNMFVMKALVPEERRGTIFRGVMPFVAADIVKIALLIAFPALCPVVAHPVIQPIKLRGRCRNDVGACTCPSLSASTLYALSITILPRSLTS